MHDSSSEQLPAGSVDAPNVLAGHAAYDLLDEPEQAAVRAEWAKRITARRIDLDYEAEFLASGESYSEADEDGHVAVRATRD